jgi:GT2 family glycosyltransferase
MSSNQIGVVVIGINYESDKALFQYLNGLTKISQGLDLNVVIVDNTERVDSSDIFKSIQKQYPQTLCLKASSNLGYFGGAAFGLKEYLINKGLPDWVMVSNVDIEFKDETFFTRLRDLGLSEEVGVIAPSIWSESWLCDRNPMMVSRPTKHKMKSYKLLFSNFYMLNLYHLISKIKYTLCKAWKRCYLTNASSSLKISRLGSSFVPREEGQNRLQEIYAPHGSCILFSKSYFLHGGKLNYPAFLFGEEIFVAETARELGLKIVYNPHLILYHNDHCSTHGFRSRKLASYMYESAVYISDRYFF